MVILSPDSSAQTSSCGSTTTLRAEGLVSTPQIGSTAKFGTTGGCIIDPKAAFAPFKIPTFDELKSLYFDQSKANKITLTEARNILPSKILGDNVYYVMYDLDVGVNPTGSGTQVILVNGMLSIWNNYTYGYGDPNSGTVFIVKGGVYIYPTATLIEAVIIAEGSICTAYDVTTACPATNQTTSQLVINGSLISLTETAPIKFRRTLADNNQPAEKINHQVKYLVLLRNLLSDTFQRWSEIPWKNKVLP